MHQMLLAFLGHGASEEEQELLLHPSSKSGFRTLKPNCTPGNIGAHPDNVHEGKISSCAAVLELRSVKSHDVLHNALSPGEAALTGLPV